MAPLISLLIKIPLEEQYNPRLIRFPEKNGGNFCPFLNLGK